MRESEYEKEAYMVWLNLKAMNQKKEWVSTRDIAEKVGMRKEIVRFRLERLLRNGKVEKKYGKDEMKRTIALWKAVGTWW